MSQASNYVLNVRLCLQGRLYDVRFIYVLILAKLQESLFHPYRNHTCVLAVCVCVYT